MSGSTAPTVGAEPSPGQRVDLVWEAPGFEQDGYDYRAVTIVPLPPDQTL